MWLKIFLLLLFTFEVFGEHVLKSIAERNEFSSISKGFQEVLQEFFVNKQIQFNFLFLREESGINPLHDILPLIKVENPNFLVNLDTNVTIFLSSSAVFIVSSCIDYLHIHNNFKLYTDFPNSLRFVIYIQNCGLRYIKNNFEYLVKTQELTHVSNSLEIFEYLLINDDNVVYLASAEWFTEVACNRPQLKVLNKFNKQTQQWDNNLENYEKFHDFHGCRLSLGVEMMQLEYGRCWGYAYVAENSLKTFGIAPEIFKAISKSLRFVPEYVLFNNSTIIVNVFLPVIRFSLENSNWMHITTTFTQARDIIITTPGELYSPYEKLLLPFDDVTWMLLFFTFLLAFVAILIINQLSEFIQTRIYGEQIQTPTLNVISTFFGISQYKLPVRHIPRFILIFFVFFCLIFRTCYQSKLFQFMTSEPRKSPPNSIQDLKERNFTVYTSLDATLVDEILENERDQWPDVKTVHILNIYHYLKTQTHNASAAMALLVNIGGVLNFDHKLKGIFKWHRIPDFFFQVTHTGFSLSKNNFFYNALDTSVQQLISAGIFDYLLQNCVYGLVSDNVINESSPLSWKTLNFGFFIWFGSCMICLLVFCAELIFQLFAEKWELFLQKLNNMSNKKRIRKLKFSKIHPIDAQELTDDLERPDEIKIVTDLN